MEQRKINGLIIDGEVYIATLSDNPATRCKKCECTWCDYKLGDKLCRTILGRDEYLILSKELTKLVNEKSKRDNRND